MRGASISRDVKVGWILAITGQGEEQRAEEEEGVKGEKEEEDRVCRWSRSEVVKEEVKEVEWG